MQFGDPPRLTVPASRADGSYSQGSVCTDLTDVPPVPLPGSGSLARGLQPSSVPIGIITMRSTCGCL